MKREAPFIDWLRFTLPYTEDSFVWIDSRFGGRIPLNKGLLSYSVAELLVNGGMCAYSPDRKQNKVMVELSARALRSLSLHQEPQNFILDAFGRGATFTRIDVALDDYRGIMNLSRVWRCVKRDEVKTRFRKFSRIVGHDRLDPSAAGDTIYGGDRSSESFLRIYDKEAESGTDGHWVRMEFEFKKDRANELAGRIARGTIDLRNLIYYYIDFQRRTPGARRGWPTAEWWEEFLQPTSRERLYFPQYEIGLEEVQQWLKTQVSSALVLVARTDGEALTKIFDEGEIKIEQNRRYKQIEAQYNAQQERKLKTERYLQKRKARK